MQIIFYIFAVAILLIDLSIGIICIKTNKNTADNYGYKMGTSLIILSILTAGILIVVNIKLYSLSIKNICGGLIVNLQGQLENMN